MHRQGISPVLPEFKRSAPTRRQPAPAPDKACPKPDPVSGKNMSGIAIREDPWFLAACHAFMSSTLEHVCPNGLASNSITTLLQGIPHPQHSVENFKEEDVMLRMGFGDDVAAVDAASSSHFVPLSAMMRNHKVSDRPVPGESRGPEVSQMYP